MRIGELAASLAAAGTDEAEALMPDHDFAYGRFATYEIERVIWDPVRSRALLVVGDQLEQVDVDELPGELAELL